MQVVHINGRPAVVTFMDEMLVPVDDPDAASTVKAIFTDAQGGVLFLKFDESQHPRDDHGRWTDAGDSDTAPSEPKGDGKPQTVYHGSKEAGFSKFKVPDPATEFMMDRTVGVHVAKDPELAVHFTETEPTGGWGAPREQYKGGVYILEIPPAEKFHTVEQKLLPYIKDPNTPKGPRNVETDQTVIGNMAYASAFRQDPGMFARFLARRWNLGTEEATAAATGILSGQPYSFKWVRQGKPIVGLDDYIAADGVISMYGSDQQQVADRTRARDLFVQEMQGKGFAGLKYINTAPMETEGVADPTSFVVFDPNDIKFKYHKSWDGTVTRPPRPLRTLGKSAPDPWQQLFVVPASAEPYIKFDPSQPRDEHGRWTDGGSDDGAGTGAGAAGDGKPAGKPSATPAQAGGGSHAPAPTAYSSRSSGSPQGSGDVAAVWEPRGGTGPSFHETLSPARFHDAISKAKSENKYGAAVYVYDDRDYAHMRTFVMPNDEGGFAIKHDRDIVSGFKSGGAEVPNFAQSMLVLATQEGGRKLDAFDTVLPALYSRAGFRAVARLAWDDKQKPPDWNYDTFKKFNGGRPDVVFMVYDPSHGKPYAPGDGVRVASYEEGQAEQAKALGNLAPLKFFDRVVR